MIVIPRRLRGAVLGVAAAGVLVATGEIRAGEGDEPGASARRLPFLVSGTIIAPSTRIALIVVLDEHGAAVQECRSHEGDTINGFQIARIAEEHVVFQRGGQTFTLRVGNQSPGGADGETRSAGGRPEIAGGLVPPPDNIEEIKKDTEALVERLKGNPLFQQGLEQLDRRFRGTSGAAPVDR